jgi:hypothetical protein
MTAVNPAAADSDDAAHLSGLRCIAVTLYELTRQRTRNGAPATSNPGVTRQNRPSMA